MVDFSCRFLELFAALLILLNIFSGFGAFLLAATMAGATYTHQEMKDDKVC
jgi:uncharacterized membrane protein YphA (DoxX/SURF4 family)